VTAEVTGARLTFHADTPNEVRALDGVDVAIAEGSFAIVIGTNGSGKSTLLNALAGSLSLDAGTIRLAGRDVTRLPEHRRAALVGRVFQNPFTGTAPGMTIAENLAIATRRGHGRGLKWALGKRLRAELVDRVASLGMGLQHRLDTPIGTLSGGQRQALTLLMATWHRPRLLLLDEHTAALDPKTAEQVLSLTSSIVSSAKLTTLMVTHSMAQAVNMGDRLVMMARGRVLHDFSGAMKERLRADDLLARFEELGREERLDEGTAARLRASYV
jgi:putative ABC transport system ATP-binding protein